MKTSSLLLFALALSYTSAARAQAPTARVCHPPCRPGDQCVDGTRCVDKAGGMYVAGSTPTASAPAGKGNTATPVTQPTPQGATGVTSGGPSQSNVSKLSSGQKINTASEDSAGLSISEKLKGCQPPCRPGDACIDKEKGRCQDSKGRIYTPGP